MAEPLLLRTMSSGPASADDALEDLERVIVHMMVLQAKLPVEERDRDTVSLSLFAAQSASYLRGILTS